MVNPIAPGLVIAGMHSHVGKTLITAGLLRSFRDLYGPRESIVGFKVGPDYIDPGYHQLASGQPCRNLDPVLCGEDRILPLYRYGAEGHRLALVEGVMGLYDGRMDLAADAPRIPFGSTAHVAQLLTLPIILVVDGSHTSDTLAALLYGIRTYPAEDSATSLRFASLARFLTGSQAHAMRRSWNGPANVPDFPFWEPSPPCLRQNDPHGIWDSSPQLKRDTTLTKHWIVSQRTSRPTAT